MISVNNLSIHFTGTDLFSDVSFRINERDRIGLVGKNGAGKSTLLNIIAGLVVPQQGEAIVPSETEIGYLKQEMETGSMKTVFEEALTAFDETLKIDKTIRKLSEEVATRTDYESKDYEKILHRLAEANDRFIMIGGQTMKADTEKVLTGLGFRREEFDRSVSEFSSGWQMRIELAKILLSQPGVILLDEPTNHLDIESIQWLEEYLSDYPGALMVVSHDRAFLDNVTQRTIEIELGKVYDYKAGYSGYVQMREDRLESQKAAWNNQQKQIRQIERFIERFRYKNTKARQVQSRVKMLEKMKEIGIEEFDKSAIHFRFPDAPRSGKIVLEGMDLGKSYGDKEVLTGLNFLVIRGDRVAFVGRNGEGKTTLSRVIVKELEHSGTLKYGHNVQIGYFAQNQGDYLDPEKTVFETIDEIAVGDLRRQVRSLLGAFLFSGDTIDKKVKVLSGGEKSRLSLAKLLLTPSNLLVMDEPTNHLDMQSKDILKNALLQYNGTLIIVSHDRDFLQGLTGKIFEFRNKGITEYPGDIYDFLDNRKLQSLKELEAAAKSVQDGNHPVSENKLNYERKKQLERNIRKLSNRLKRLETEIDKLEEKQKEFEGILNDPEQVKNIDFDQFSKDVKALDAEMKIHMNTWEELHREIEFLNSQMGKE